MVEYEKLDAYLHGGNYGDTGWIAGVLCLCK